MDRRKGLEGSGLGWTLKIHVLCRVERGVGKKGSIESW